MMAVEVNTSSWVIKRSSDRLQQILLFSTSYGYIARQTGLFSVGKVTSQGEGKPWIQNQEGMRLAIQSHKAYTIAGCNK